ncbi:hypothetical protein DFH29DRAFT_251651 [Suillus ampliporus]|nr:hypothetical protein DFH29DRAFT_251651 [Suillus ampliporus]
MNSLPHLQIPSLPSQMNLFSQIAILSPTHTPNKVLFFPSSTLLSHIITGSFSQPHTNSYEYTPVPHRDREVNIWKLACQERVEFLLRRYGTDTIKALVASEARARAPSTHPSNTRFRLYTPASYLERASYTYKSAEFEAVDFDMDDEEDEDDDLDEGDLGADYDEDYDDEDDDEDGEGLFLMDGIVTPTVPSILVPTVPSIAPTIAESVPLRSPPRSVSPPAVSSPHVPLPRPSCVSPPRRTPSPPSTPPRLPAPSIPTPPSIPAPPSIPTPTPALEIQIPETPTLPPSTPTHQTTLALPRTPPLSSLHVTLLSEPPRAFMGRGTPPDRRRLSEWGRWGCVQLYGQTKGGSERRRLAMQAGRHEENPAYAAR